MTENNIYDVVIFGGGLNGLFLAYFLRKKYPHYKIAIVERAPQMGGLIETQKVGSAELEKFYHHIFLTDTILLETINTLNLADKLVFKDSSIANLNQQVFQPFVTPVDLLKYKGLSFFTKLKIGLYSLLIQKDRNGDKYANINSKEWITKKMGKEAWEKLWGPLFEGKFHDFAANLSLSFLWTRLHVRANSKKTGKEQLGYMKGSFSQISKKMVELLPTMEIVFFNGAEIQKITKADKDYQIQIGGQTLKTKFIISTFSPIIFKKVFQEFISADYLAKLNSVKYLAVICPTFILDKQLTPYYWTNIVDQQIPFKGIIEQTNLFDYPEYESNKIVYLSHYLKQDDPLLQKDDNYLKSYYLQNLEKAVGKKVEPKDIRINRAMFAQPVFTLDMNQDMIKFKTPIDNVFQCTMVNLLPMERGINSSIHIANEFVNSINL
ncbi:MAG: FAD-dependent oxidoreductase [Candidatus Abawacabacteria bacterium]|nr:FAD-dependent oxidoreductase [Candidatus Abawacabacteria bacterium]